MPTPKADESKDGFIDRCIPEVIADGTAKDGSQARAVCESMWDRRDMANQLNSDSVSSLKSLIEDGNVNTESDWSFTAEDMDKLRGGDEGENFERVECAHLGVETDAEPKTQARFIFPVAKLTNGALTVFRSGVIAAKQRAGQTGDDSIQSAADELLELIDGKREESMADNLHTLLGVEIFRVGDWNGDKFTEADLDEMVANFDKVGFRPPVKLGHTNNPDDRAFGFVDKIRRQGDKLLADLSDVPEKVVDLIREKAYDAVSSEIFFNLKRNGETFRRALAGVALLGAQVPAVSGLKPLSDALPFSTDDVDTRMYRMGDETMAEDKGRKETKADLEKRLEEAQNQIAQLQQDGQKAQEYRDQAEAMQKRLAQIEEERLAERIEAKIKDFNVPALVPHLRALYDLAARQSEKRTFGEGDKAEELSAEEIVDRLVAYIADNTAWLFDEKTRGAHDEDTKDASVKLDEMTKERATKDGIAYSEAFSRVCAENPELAREYATH